MPFRVCDDIELHLAWCSRYGKAVGTFRAKVVSIRDQDRVEVRIDQITRVVPSNPSLGGPSDVQQVADEVAAFTRKSIVVPVAVAEGAPMYVTNPLDAL